MTEQTIYSMREATVILKTKPWRIVHCFTSGKCPEPTLRLAGRRVFTVADLKRLAKALNTKKPDPAGRGGEDE